MAIKTYLKTSKASLSTNLTVSEFACHGKGCCATVKIDETLVKYIQRIRDHFGKRVFINSGYRCAKHNKAVGGSTNSNHTKGMAADIRVEDVTPAEVAKYAESIGILGIGLYETASDGYFVHIDTRTKKAFWYGQKQAYRSTFGGAPAVDSGYTLVAFVRDVQKACGATVDGIAGPKTLFKTITVSAKKNIKHDVVEAIQKRLLALGYVEVGAADGVAGSKFTAAVIRFQKENGCVVDGVVTARGKTWRKLLGMA